MTMQRGKGGKNRPAATATTAAATGAATATNAPTSDPPEHPDPNVRRYLATVEQYKQATGRRFISPVECFNILSEMGLSYQGVQA